MTKCCLLNVSVFLVLKVAKDFQTLRFIMTLSAVQANSSSAICVSCSLRCGVLMMFVTNNNLKSEIKGTGKVYNNALDEAFQMITTAKKVS